MKYLKKLFQSHPTACAWFIKLIMGPKTAWWKYYLLECKDEYVRGIFSEVIIIALRTLGPHEDKLYIYSDPNEDDPARPIAPVQTGQKAIVAQYLDFHIAQLYITRPHWKNFHQYWWLVKEFALIGPYERKYLASRNIVFWIIDYYMGEYSPYRPTPQYPPRVKLGDRSQTVKLVTFMEALAAHVRASTHEGIVASGKKPPTLYVDERQHVSDIIPLHSICGNLLFNRDFFNSLIRQSYCPEGNQEIIQHVSFEDKPKSEFVMDVVMETLGKAYDSNIDSMLTAVEAIISINDSLQRYRIEKCLNHWDPKDSNLNSGILPSLIEGKMQKYLKYLVFIVRLIQKYKVVAEFLYETRDTWCKWAINWLHDKVSMRNAGQSWQIDASEIEGMTQILECLKKFNGGNKYLEDVTLPAVEKNISSPQPAGP